MSLEHDGPADATAHPVRSVLITGGGTGIGADLARGLAASGCHVIISGRRADALEATADSSENISVVVGDVTDSAHRSEVAAALGAAHAPRGLVHAAGHFQIGRLESLSVDDWRRSFEVNVEARWALSCACADLLAGGRVLFIGSDAGANPRDGAAAYSIAQAASETLRRALQVEWADRPVAVGAFKPGLVDTEMVRGFMQLSAEDFPARAVYEEYVSSGQVAAPTTVARFAAWLLLGTSAQRFGSTEWDIRDTEHHAEWLDGSLYP